VPCEERKEAGVYLSSLARVKECELYPDSPLGKTGLI